MGCDIHIIIEQKVKDKWVGTFATNKAKYNDSLLGYHRNYDFFNRLAGVRCYNGVKLNQPKGIPNNISDLSKLVINEWEGDGHSHSYFSAREFCDLFNKEFKGKARGSYDILGIDIAYHDILGDMLGIDIAYDDILGDRWRVIIFFDN